MVALLTALAVGLAGIVAYALQWSRIQSVSEQQLFRDYSEFQTLASTNIDRDTSQQFTDLDDLLRAALQSKQLTESNGAFAIVGDEVRWVSPDSVTVHPEADPDFVATVAALAERSERTIDRYSTAHADFMYLVAPVTFAGTGQKGALVRVVDLNVERRALNDTYGTYVIVALGSICVVALITWLLVARLLQPIHWVRITATEITEHDLSRRIPVRGHDDIAALANTVNTMLDRLESAASAQKQLLDDVGHELRTPLTIIRGHLELMEATDPMDAEIVRTLALEELARMSDLVNDLLLLAQSERNDFVVPQAVDIGRLTDETYEKVRVLGHRPWSMDALADVTVTCDPQRVTQAWLQLAANAVKYSPDGSPIGMGSRVEGDSVRLWVRDHGMGFTTEEREIVLSRFGRSRRAGARRTDSVGLGLAIVNSIAKAHGGKVDIDSVTEVGSTVSLVLPRERPLSSEN